MIILAGVAINLGAGDNGIIGLTSNTIEQYTNSVEQEQSGETWRGCVCRPDIRQTPDSCRRIRRLRHGDTWGRAAFIILRRYIKRYHKDTIASIVSTWAPAIENQTQKYIDAVSGQMGIDPLLPIKYEDKETMCNLVAAMAKVECGRPIELAVILKGYELA